MAEEHDAGGNEEIPRRSRSSSKKCGREQEESIFVKNIPSYISCIVTTSSVFLLNLIFIIHGIYYYDMYITLAILFIIANTSITFVGTFKIIT